MNPYSFVVSVHVIVAILGLGPLMTLAVLTRRPALASAAARPVPPEPALRAFLRLLRVAQVSLGLMFVTGAVLVAMVHGAFGHQWWMIISVALFLVLGGGTGLAQSYLKKALTGVGAAVHLEQAHRALAALCVVVVLIAWLMESKPF